MQIEGGEQRRNQWDRGHLEKRFSSALHFRSRVFSTPQTGFFSRQPTRGGESAVERRRLLVSKLEFTKGIFFFFRAGRALLERRLSRATLILDGNRQTVSTCRGGPRVQGAGPSHSDQLTYSPCRLGGGGNLFTITKRETDNRRLHPARKSTSLPCSRHAVA